MDVNFRSVYFCCKAVISHMIKGGGGKIVNIASIAGKTGEDNNGIYCVTKTAIISLTQSMARELGRYEINVNAVLSRYDEHGSDEGNSGRAQPVVWPDS